MINLQSGTSSVVWLAIKESLPAGYTQSNYKLTITEPVSGLAKVFYPQATETNYIWSRFTISVGSSESSSTASIPTINLYPGILHYNMVDTISGATLSIGLVTVSKTETPVPTIVRTKDTKVYKR